MNKKVKIISLLIIGIFLISFNTSFETNTSPKINSLNSTVSETNTQTNPQIINIAMKDEYFVPSKINITINTYIVFNLTNEGVYNHTFTFENTSFGINIQVNVGQNATVNFTAPSTPQTLVFYCRFHQRYGMEGSINIVNPITTSSSSSSSVSTTTTTNSGNSTNQSSSSLGFDSALFPISLILLVIIERSKKRKI